MYYSDFDEYYDDWGPRRMKQIVSKFYKMKLISRDLIQKSTYASTAPEIHTVWFCADAVDKVIDEKLSDGFFHYEIWGAHSPLRSKVLESDVGKDYYVLSRVYRHTGAAYYYESTTEFKKCNHVLSAPDDIIPVNDLNIHPLSLLLLSPSEECSENLDILDVDIENCVAEF